jgi:hypothetical protein
MEQSKKEIERERNLFRTERRNLQKSKDGEIDLLINKEKYRLVGVFIRLWVWVPHMTLRSCNHTRYLETLTNFNNFLH